MIDFRYHLVSIISIFLALAVGIVLGAGPLQQQIGTTLNAEVTQLRKDKAELRAQLDALSTQDKARNTFLVEATPRLVDGVLLGRTVAVVSLPGADEALTAATVEAVGQAGARVASEVVVQDGWAATDAESVKIRGDAVREAGSALDLQPADPKPIGSELDRVLGSALATRDLTANTPATGAAKAIQVLTAAKLIVANQADPLPAQLVVIVAGPVGGPDVKARAGLLATWVGLCRSLGGASLGVVAVTQEQPEQPKDTDSLITAIRSDKAAAKEVSSIDNGLQPLGVVSIPYALADHGSVGAGHYGTGPDASALYAPIPKP